MWAKFCGKLLKFLGWTSDSGPVPENKGIILGVPHTSIWDGVISYLFYTQFGETHQAKLMIKKELFIGPLGWLLRKVGGVPVDRKNPASMFRGLIYSMKEAEHFVLAMSPEGTRKPIKRWKTGCLTIAREVGCPIYLGYFDWGRKRIGIGEKFEPSGDINADIARIQTHYESLNLVGKNPKNYLTR